MLESVDVSWPQKNYQPGTESGVIIAATSGDGGSLFTQATLAEDVANARAAGKEVGFYHFNGPGGTPESHAEYFWAAIEPYFKEGDITALDIESSSAGKVAPQSPAWASRFVTRLAQLRGLTLAKARIGIYGNRTDMKGAGYGVLEKNGCWLWLAAPGGYPENTPIGEWSHWTIIQYSSAGNIDRDQSQLTFAEIADTTTAKPTWKEADMLYIYSPNRGGGIVSPTGFYPLDAKSEEAQVALATYGTPNVPNGTLSDRQWDVARQTAINVGEKFATAVAAKLGAPTATPAVDVKALAAALAAALPQGQSATAAQIAAELVKHIS